MSMMKKLIMTGICAAVILLLSHYAFAAGSGNTEFKSVKMLTTSVTLRTGQERALLVETSPSGADEKTLTWSSSNPGVVSVDNSGNIKGISPGKATITVASPNGKTAKCTVTVPEGDVDVSRLEMVMDTAFVRVNQERVLYVEIFPDGADYKSIEWASSNPEIAVVTYTGVDDTAIVLGVSPGTAEITATSRSGKTAVCRVTVPSAAVTELEQQVSNKDIPVSTSSLGEKLSAAALRLDVENAAKDSKKSAKQITLTYTGKTRVSTAALRSAAFTAAYNAKEASLRFRTLDEDGKQQGQLTVNPQNAGAEDKDIRLEVYASAGKTANAKARAEKHFGAPAAVVRLTQEGAFNMTVQVAAKADLTGLNAKTLRIYRYSGGTYTLCEDQEYQIDANGYIHFSVSKGGTYVLVSA